MSKESIKMQQSQRQKQKQKTREHLILVAFNQFAKDGLIATRTADIANAAKVSHGTVFSHFPTREDLLDAVVEEFGKKLMNRLHELVGENSDIKEILEAHLKGLEEYELFYTRLISEVSLLHESARNTLIMIQSTISFHFNQVVEREAEASKIREMPFHLMFNSWIGLIHYYLVNKDLFAPKESVISRYGHQLIEYYIKLISKESEVD